MRLTFLLVMFALISCSTDTDVGAPFADGLMANAYNIPPRQESKMGFSVLALKHKGVDHSVVILVNDGTYYGSYESGYNKDSGLYMSVSPNFESKLLFSQSDGVLLAADKKSPVSLINGPQDLGGVFVVEKIAEDYVVTQPVDDTNNDASFWLSRINKETVTMEDVIHEIYAVKRK